MSMGDVINTISIIDRVSQTNDPNYSISKLIEELNELAAELSKYLNKKHAKDMSLQPIIEELGDVELRIQIVQRHLGITGPQIMDRMNYKAAKLEKYMNSGEYKNKV
jgi:NTP pyrophosphatase (non-canonical NTP hydrolase)